MFMLSHTVDPEAPAAAAAGQEMSPAMLTRSRSALGGPASPAGVGQLGAMMQGLALAEGTAVGWCVALKPPKSSQVVVVDCAGDGKWQETSADAWLREGLLNKGWSSWVAYNDEPPAASGASGTKFGHCKGILAWRKDRIAWLVHSVPLWPDSMTDDALPPLVSSGLRCGQSFILLSLPRSEALLRCICDQIRLMDACVYGGRVTPDQEEHVPFREDRFGEHLATPFSRLAPSLVPLGRGVWHLAKDQQWGKVWVDGRPVDQDFYEDCLARTPPFEGFWHVQRLHAEHVQSWLNGNAPPFGATQHCDNIVQVRLPDGAPYETSKDHAKWAVCRDRPLCLIGDLNRTQTQAKRGGGGVVVADEGLWRALTSVVHKLGADHPVPPALASYDEFHVAGLSGGLGRMGAGRQLRAQQGTPGRVRGSAAQRSGRRGVRTAAAATDSLDTGGADSDSGADTASTTSHGKAGSCNCKSAGCSHGRCGCRRSGRPCTALCGCKGACSNGGSTEEEVESKPSPPAAAALAAAPPPAMPAPQEAAVALGAALAGLAAARNAAAAVSAVAPLMPQQAGQPSPPPLQHPAQPAAAPPPPARAQSAQPAAAPPPPAQVQPAAGTAAPPPAGSSTSHDKTNSCHCKSVGCSHGRCGCKKAGRPCTEFCGCKGACSNSGGAEGGKAQPEGCVVS